MYIRTLDYVSESKEDDGRLQYWLKLNNGAKVELLRKVGEGQSSVVLLVRQCLDKDKFRDCALKVLKLEHLGNPFWLSRFRRELVIHKTVSDRSSVVPDFLGKANLISSKASPDLPGFLMEYVEGSNLNDYYCPTLKDLINVARSILLALREIHDLKVIHRDLKPTNIILSSDIINITRETRARIIDLGLAGMRRSKKDFESEASGRLLYGADEIRPPEVRLGMCNTLIRDLFAVGKILRRLIDGNDNLIIPDAFNDFVDKLLTVPGERFQSCEEALEALERIYLGEFA